MGYSVARGYISTMRSVRGVDRVAPCGLAWQVVRGSTQVPSACRDEIDAQYEEPLGLDVPFAVPGGALPDLLLYRLIGPKHHTIDKHPNVAGQYLNALTFFATLFGRSPLGAAAPLPTGSSASGDRPLEPDELRALQTAAYGTVKACGAACGLGEHF